MNQVTHSHEAASFACFSRTMAGKRWHQSGGTPTIALHGWLDNANSFDRLAPLLPELDLLALDFAGHGLSDHRPPGIHYHPLLDIQDVLCIADQLGWETFNLIGHSMGAAVSSELCCLFPERVRKAVLIDGFLATGGMPVESRLQQNRDAVTRMLSTQAKPPRTFSSPEEMAIRVTEATDQTLDAARVLVERGHQKVTGGVTWRTDPRIRFPTPLRHTREQIDELLTGAEVPSLLIVAEQGDTWYQGEIEAARACHPQLFVERIPGPHHIHLEPRFVDAVAMMTRRFLALDE